MVQFQVEKVPGQRGHMVVQEDGTIISSSGEMASNEMMSQQITTLIANSFPVDFSRAPPPSGETGEGGNGSVHNGRRSSVHGNEPHANGCSSPARASGDGPVKGFKWNRITVEFGGTSYVACLSNRKVHLLKRNHLETPKP